MEKTMLVSIFVGCLIGLLRYLVVDKWKINTRVCNFCLTFWFCTGFSIIGLAILPIHFSYVQYLFIIPIAIAVANAIASITYVYTKNAN